MENVRINETRRRAALWNTRPPSTTCGLSASGSCSIRDLFSTTPTWALRPPQGPGPDGRAGGRSRCSASSIEALAGGFWILIRQERIYLELLEHVRDRILLICTPASTPKPTSRHCGGRRPRAQSQENSSERHPRPPVQRASSPSRRGDYLHNLLPTTTPNATSGCGSQAFPGELGLDRFYVEELERDYDDNGWDLEELYQIVRKGLS